MNQIFSILGVRDLKTYLEKYIVPFFILDCLVLVVFLFAFSNKYVHYLGFTIFVLILVLMWAYPRMLLDNQSREIEENLHYFITYAGALATVKLDRKEMFRDLSDKVRYKEIAKAFEKLLYLVESIKIDFSTSAYKVASLYKSEHFSRFLERMGIALSFSEDTTTFFAGEQKALMRAYSIIYKEGLERLKMISEMFVSLILAFAFVMAIILLMPFLTGVSADKFMIFGVLGIFILDLSIIVFSNFYLPTDPLYHDLGYDQGRKNVLYLFLGIGGFCLIVSPFIIMFDLSVIVKAALIFSPLIIVGRYSLYQESLVMKKEILFPPFIRSLGDVHQSKGGTLTTTIETLLPHNFGLLDEMVERVYKRLLITKDKFNSWLYFSKESGSALIAEFVDIFVSVVYRGGSAQQAGEIVSDNMETINGLRELKSETTASLKGGIYGVFFGFVLTLYISLFISSLLMNIFSSMTSGINGMAKDIIAGIIPISQTGGDIATAMHYMGFAIIIHAFLSAYLIRSVEGGNKFSLLFDFVAMIWMSAAIEIVLTVLFKLMFSSYI